MCWENNMEINKSLSQQKKRAGYNLDYLVYHHQYSNLLCITDYFCHSGAGCHCGRNDKRHALSDYLKPIQDLGVCLFRYHVNDFRMVHVPTWTNMSDR